MIKASRVLIQVAIALLLASASVIAQVENVQVGDPVYDLLKRLEVKGIITKYHDGFLPISRSDVAGFLRQADTQRDRLTPTERDILDDFRDEYAVELGLTGVPRSVLFSDTTSFGERVTDLFRWKQKYLYAYRDSTAALFMNFIFRADIRAGRGTMYGNTTAETELIGGRIRGTIGKNFGFSLQGTNGLVFGDKDFAKQTDARLEENFRLNLIQSTSFDEMQGYLKYRSGWFSIEAGREQILWGNSLFRDGKLYISDHPPLFDMIRLDAEYGVVKFSFFHGWLLDASQQVPNPYSGGTDTYIAPKYIAGHRIELSFPYAIDIAANEMIIYSRPSPELAYLNPVNFYKSAEHSLQDRDNSLLTFDASTHFWNNVQFSGTFLMDDIDFSKIGTKDYVNLFAYQAGAYYIEPAGLQNSDLAVEYTRINPYVYSHHIPVNSYTNHGFVLGDSLRPNSDGWTVRAGYLVSREFRFDLTYSRQRHGDNIVDAGGNLVTNVGGNALFGHRVVDSLDVDFLGGARTDAHLYGVHLVVQIAKQFFFESRYGYRTTRGVSPVDGTLQKGIDRYFFLQFRCEF